MASKFNKMAQEWRKILTSEQFYVTRKHGTERAFTGTYDKHYEKGVAVAWICSILSTSTTRAPAG